MLEKRHESLTDIATRIITIAAHDSESHEPMLIRDTAARIVDGVNGYMPWSAPTDANIRQQLHGMDLAELTCKAANIYGAEPTLYEVYATALMSKIDSILNIK